MIQNPYSGRSYGYPPWYSMAEAAKEMGLDENTLLTLVYKGDIRAVAYTKPCRFLLFSPEPSGWIGHAVCRYRGHMILDKHHILTLLEGDKPELKHDWGQLLESSGVMEWDCDYPFEKELPHKPLTDWQPLTLDDQEIKRFAAIPMPTEGKHARAQLMKGIFNTVSKIAEIQDDPNAIDNILPLTDRDSWDDLHLFFSNKEFAPSKISVAVSEIHYYNNFHSNENAIDHLVSEVKQLPAQSNTKRENQLHALIKRIVKAHPDQGAIQIWKILEADNEKLKSHFDTDCIIESIASDRIYWKSRNGSEQGLSWNSFQSTLSKLKKEL